MSPPPERAPEVPSSNQPNAPVGRDWIASGAVLMIFSGLAGMRWASPASKYSMPILVVGGGLILCGLALGLRHDVARSERRHRTLWLLPRLILCGVAIALVAASISAPLPQPCPPEAAIGDAGELIHSRFAGEHTVCTYEYTGRGGSL